MNAYEKAQQLGLTGDPAAQVAILQTLTVSDISIESVKEWLRATEVSGIALWIPTSPTTMSGVIESAKQSATEVQQAGIGYMWSVVYGGTGQYLRTTDPAWAPRVFGFIQMVATLAPSINDLVDSFYALDGGRPYKDLTVEQFAAQRTAAESIAEKTLALELVTNTAAEAAREEYRKGDSTPESIAAAALAVLERA